MIQLPDEINIFYPSEGVQLMECCCAFGINMGFHGQVLSKYAPRFQMSSNTVILCLPTEMLVKLIFASCWYELMTMHSVLESFI